MHRFNITCELGVLGVLLLPSRLGIASHKYKE